MTGHALAVTGVWRFQLWWWSERSVTLGCSRWLSLWSLPLFWSTQLCTWLIRMCPPGLPGTFGTVGWASQIWRVLHSHGNGTCHCLQQCAWLRLQRWCRHCPECYRRRKFAWDCASAFLTQLVSRETYRAISAASVICQHQPDLYC